MADGLAPDRTASCVWRVSPEVIAALDERFGEPVDCYVNGSQVWLRDDGPGGIGIEWRLHPVAGYVRPAGVTTYDLWETMVWALRTEAEPPAPLTEVWDGLEGYACDGDEVEPAPLAAALTEALGVAPDAYGLVDHTAIGDRWEQSLGKVSVIAELLAQLDG